MDSLFASFKRTPRIRTRKDSISADADIVCPPSRSSTLASRKTRPPPLQIIPELAENELVIDISSDHSPATARPTQSFPQQAKLHTSRITLSAYTFSVDDALLMLGDETPRSPALSASSSTSDGASSEVVLTPRASDDEDGYDFPLSTPRLSPQRVSIRPLCIIKTRSLICQEDDDIQNDFDEEEPKVISPPVTEEQPEPPAEANAATEAAEQDFYTHEFEDFISLSCVVPSPTYPARRDSLTLAPEGLPTVIDVPEPKPRGRSRHSKPLPLLPPATPPLSSLPCISTLPLVQTTAQKSIARRKRNTSSLHNYPPLPASRPLPRMAVPLDIEESIFSADNFDITSRGSIAIKQVCHVEEHETSLSGMSGEVTLPRSSTDSDAPRSSIDSTSSFVSSSSSNTPVSPFSFPNSPSPDGSEFESTQRLRSRWSSSTLASVTVEPPRTTTLFSPLKSVGSRARRVLLPPQKVPPRTPPHLTSSIPSKNKQASPLRTLGKHIRRKGPRSSTSSAGTSSSECDSLEGSPSGLKRKPIPALMFLRPT